MVVEDPATLALSLKLVLCDCQPTCEARTRLDNLPLCHALIRLLANGQQLSLDELAEATGLAPQQLTAKLARMELDFDDAGRVIGAGLTLCPTPHHFEINSHALFTWCALDALMYPSLLAQIVKVMSPCRATGRPIQLTVTADGLIDVDPPEAVVSLVLAERGQPPRQAFCGQVHFFSSAPVAQAWLRERPKARVVPVATAFELGKLLVAQRGT
jgi:alkylmercury lyase